MQAPQQKILLVERVVCSTMKHLGTQLKTVKVLWRFLLTVIMCKNIGVFSWLLDEVAIVVKTNEAMWRSESKQLNLCVWLGGFSM